MSLNAVSRSGVVTLLIPLLLCVAVNLIPAAEAVWLTIPTTGTKCVSEEIQSKVVVLADYYILHGIDGNYTSHEVPTISARVTSPYGNNLHHNENVTHGQFAFTTNEAGNYLACFWLDKHQDNEVSLALDWKNGIAAKDWESVAKKEKIEGVELELRRLASLVESIHENINYLKNREAEMREVSETTNARVAWFSIMSLGICILTSVGQLWHLKRFFHKKKLI